VIKEIMMSLNPDDGGPESSPDYSDWEEPDIEEEDDDDLA
jgi:hypothetical protein